MQTIEKLIQEKTELEKAAMEERDKRVASSKEAEERSIKRKLGEQAEEKLLERKDREIRILIDKKQSEIDETLRTEKEVVDKLEKDAIELEHRVEKHRKYQESLKIKCIVVPTPTNADSVEGTDGKTPDTPFMSQHLKNILKQTHRSY